MSFAIPTMKGFSSPITVAGGSLGATTLLLHFDGSNLATTTTDSSTNNVAITFNSYAAPGPRLSTSYKKFGTTSLSNDNQFIDSNTYGYISFPNSNIFNFGSNDWTIDFWWQPVLMATATNSNLWTVFHSSFVNQTAGIGGIVLKRISRLGYDLDLSISTDGSTYAVNNLTIGANAFDSYNSTTFYHVAIERHGSNINGYVNGTKTAISTTFSGSIYYNASNPLAFGGGFMTTYVSSAQTGSFFDELRIVNGVAKYGSASFTPPSSAYTS